MKRRTVKQKMRPRADRPDGYYVVLAYRKKKKFEITFTQILHDSNNNREGIFSPG